MEIRLPDFRMIYDDRGEGRPLLFIHGFPLNRRMWEPQIEYFSGITRVLAPDLRGHGESEPAPGIYSMAMLADDCYRLLEAAGARQPAVICGLSMGGYIALAFYRQYPERVAGLILAATRAGADSPEGKANREKAAAQARQEGVGAIVDSMLPKIMAPKTYETNPELVSRVRKIMGQTSVEGIVGAQLGMKDRPDSMPLLSSITAPTLILHGAEDQIIPPGEAEAMHAAIPNSHLRLLPEAGHLLNLEQPDLFNQAIEQFLNTVK